MQDHRQTALVAQFQALYGCAPFAVATAPGRINLIGEHIDYEGYGVMPMALSQACSVAIAWEPAGTTPAATAAGTKNTSNPIASATLPGISGQQQNYWRSLRVANARHDLYPAAELMLNVAGQLQGGCPSWCKYIHAAYKGVLEFAASKQQQVPHPCSILLLIDGKVPPGAGLSSSSAVVVAAAMALLALWRIEASPVEVAEMSCSCERFVGTQGGGMDQAVACMALQGVALHVEFNPVRATPVALPAGGAFVVANCLTPSHKAETAATRFNLKVLECRLAAMLCAKQLASITPDVNSSSGTGNKATTTSSSNSLDWKQVKVLKEVEAGMLQFAWSAAGTAGLGHARESLASQLVQAVGRLLPQSSYQLQQVAELLGTTVCELASLLPPALQNAAAAPDLQLKLQQRAMHVFAESQRVIRFKQLCLDPDLSENEKLCQLGSLMDGSHSSCASLYQCSCEELDTLVAVAKKAGALGARLTGAGWGGCVVALVPAAGVGAFMQQLQRHFYEPAVAAGRLETLDQLDQYMFATVPAAGASVMVLQHDGAQGEPQ